MQTPDWILEESSSFATVSSPCLEEEAEQEQINQNSRDSYQRHQKLIINENGGCLDLQVDLCFMIYINMFPEGSEIPIEDLVRIGMGLKSFEDVQDMVGVRKRVLFLIEIIRELRVEKDEDDNHYVKIPVGTLNSRKLIALRNLFMFDRVTMMDEWLHTTRFDYCHRLSLVLKRISEYPVSLNCPKVALLHIRYGEDSTTLPAHLFQGMKELRVLSLDVPSLPYSLDVLRNLRSLYLKVKKLKYMSVIGGLINLEFLSISTLSLTNIPQVMGQLENLRLLDVGKMNIAYISPGVFSRMSKLEELYFPSSFKRWGLRRAKGEERMNASLSEILSLSLNALQICIPNASLLPKESPIFKNIRQFKILLPNNSLYRPFEKGSMNMLQLTGDACDIKESGICNLMRRTGHLSLIRVRNLKNLVRQLEDYHFPLLKEMIITECDELEYLIDIREDCIPFSLFWELKSLHLSMLSNLKAIWRGPRIGWFQNLREINIRFCHKLKHVFPMSMAGDLRSVRRIEILDCDEMEGIFKTEVVDYLHGFYGLEELYLYSLPKLVGFLVEKDYTKVSLVKNTDVTSNMEMYCAFSSKLLVKKTLGNLKKLKIAFCGAIKVIFSCKDKHGVLNSLEVLELFGLRNLVHIWYRVPLETKAFWQLQVLVLVDCHNSYLFSPRVANLLVQLKKIQISRCENMEEIVANESGRKVEVVFGQLWALEIQHMPNLRIFYGGICTIKLPLLASLKLNECDKMESFSNGSLHTPLLTEIEINGRLHSTERSINAAMKWSKLAKFWRSFQ